MEHILSSSIVNFLETEKLLSMHQHGFRKHRSCETQLALFSHDILRAMDEGQQADCACLDFKKAFDAVPHCRLLTKIRAYGIGSQICDWLEDFLGNRTQ